MRYPDRGGKRGKVIISRVARLAPAVTFPVTFSLVAMLADGLGEASRALSILVRDLYPLPWLEAWEAALIGEMLGAL